MTRPDVRVGDIWYFDCMAGPAYLLIMEELHDVYRGTVYHVRDLVSGNEERRLALDNSMIDQFKAYKVIEGV